MSDGKSLNDGEQLPALSFTALVELNTVSPIVPTAAYTLLSAMCNKKQQTGVSLQSIARVPVYASSAIVPDYVRVYTNKAVFEKNIATFSAVPEMSIPLTLLIPKSQTWTNQLQCASMIVSCTHGARYMSAEQMAKAKMSFGCAG